MSEARGAVGYERSDEEKLQSLIERDIDPEITRMAKSALRNLQEGAHD